MVVGRLWHKELEKCKAERDRLRKALEEAQRQAGRGRGAMSDPKVVRYALTFDDPEHDYDTAWMSEKEDGNYVRYSDYARLEAERDRLREALEPFVAFFEEDLEQMGEDEFETEYARRTQQWCQAARRALRGDALPRTG